MHRHPLDLFQIELPSRSFVDASARAGGVFQPAAARNLRETISDAALVHRLVGCTPRLAVTATGDFPADGPPPAELAGQARIAGIKFGSVHPTLAGEARFAGGSLASPDAAVREAAIAHCRRAVDLMPVIGADTLSLCLPDGIHYPGQDDFLARKGRLKDGLRRVHDILTTNLPDALLLLEYKPFRPSFYHADIADWGLALLYCQHAGGRAKVLIDLGHHFPGQNIEQIVANLLDERQIGGFHLNDRRHADDGLTPGSMDPYQVFRIFHELFNDLHRRAAAGEGPAPVAFALDPAPDGPKPKLEAALQSVDVLQRLWLKAAGVDRGALGSAQAEMDIVRAETVLRAGFDADVEAELLAWRRDRALPEDPLAALRESDEVARRARDRGGAHAPASAVVMRSSAREVPREEAAGALG